MSLILKPGVDFSGLSVEIMRGVWEANAEFIYLGLDCVITSGRDGTHKTTSYHYSGDAVDLRSQHVPRSRVIHLKGSLAKRLGPKYDVILEHLGGPQEHFHVEYDRRRANG